jgi:hypothetical protein
MLTSEHIEPHLGKISGDHSAPTPTTQVVVKRHPALRWLWHDLPYITMLTLVVIGVILRFHFYYWALLIPLLGMISVATGWQHSKLRAARLELVCQMALTWCAVLFAIYLLFNGSVKGVLNANATSLAMLTLLALGTFTAGVQAKEWRIGAVGVLLFLAEPGLGWLDQSPLLLAAAAVVLIIVGGLAWWISQAQQQPDPNP